MILGDQTLTVEVGVRETLEGTQVVGTPEEGEIQGEDLHHKKGVTD